MTMLKLSFFSFEPWKNRVSAALKFTLEIFGKIYIYYIYFISYIQCISSFLAFVVDLCIAVL